MIRQGDWKLNYYHGLEPQLFNLAEDPYELHDLAQDPGYRRVRQDLIDRVLDGWDPNLIASQMARKVAEQQVFESWVKNVQPPDQYRWELRPEMDYLDPL